MDKDNENYGAENIEVLQRGTNTQPQGGRADVP